MDSSQLAGGAEECSSSESGWTMYLASPMHGQTPIEDDEVPTSEEDGGDNGGVAGGGEDGDSLASDASSGPPNRSLANLNGSFDRAPIRIQDSSEEEEEDDKEDLRADKYVSRKSLKNKEKKREDRDASVSHMAEDRETVFLGGENLAKK